MKKLALLSFYCCCFFQRHLDSRSRVRSTQARRHDHAWYQQRTGADESFGQHQLDGIAHSRAHV